MNKVLKKESGSVKLYRLCSIDVMNLDIIVNRNPKATDTKDVAQLYENARNVLRSSLLRVIVLR
jgi:hypothetical protein